MKIIPFYLPQYHEIPENNEWWGKGFTEWTNVKNARPLYEGHKQPKVPQNNNYYCLLDEKVIDWQIKLAKKYGIYGFCFYHYWFDGHLLLEKPIEQYLQNRNLDLPFCLCWANPDWTKIWAGKGSEVLIHQNYMNKSDLEKHMTYLINFFKDPRYIKEDGQPVFIIYSPEEIPNLSDIVSYIRKRVVDEGFPGIKLMYQYYVSPDKDECVRKQFDYKIRFQPVHALHEIEDSGRKGIMIKILHFGNNIIKKFFKSDLSDHLLRLRKTSYDEVWNKVINYEPKDSKDVACAFVNWDNTPRRGNSGRVIVGGTPKKFENYMKQLLKKVDNCYGNEYVFITAWNEWSEGSYLEPDKDDGCSYLSAISEAISSYEEK